MKGDHKLRAKLPVPGDSNGVYVVYSTQISILTLTALPL